MRRYSTFLAAAAAAALLLTPAGVAAQVALGTAANFGVLASAAVTNTGPTSVFGDVGVSAGSAPTGFPPGMLTGTIQSNNGVAGTAQTDLGNALVASGGVAGCQDLTGINLGGLSLPPGIYCFSSSAQLTGSLILDFQGNPNAAFLFRIGSTLTTAPGSNVFSINTGNAVCTPNVNFRVGSSAVLDVGTNFAGNILAVSSISLLTGATLRGRALANTAAVTLQSNAIVGGCPFAALPPGFVGGGGVGGGGVGGGGVISIPTLQEWTLIVLALLLAAGGGWFARRRTVRR